MSPKDINLSYFSEETKLKLDIFENYTTAWLPTFLNCNYFKKIYICDFFSGSGYDLEGNAGSPIRTINVLNKFKNQILSNNCSINLIFNDKNKSKSKELENHVLCQIDKEIKNLVYINVLNYSFDELFKSEFIQKLKTVPNLFLIDQYGFSNFTSHELNILENFDKTDFIVFSSTSYIKRFSNLEIMSKYFPNIDKWLKDVEHDSIHINLVEYLKTQLPEKSLIELYPFTIKKGPNIYGLIFGSKHPLGIDKFLKITWDQNPQDGLSNIFKAKSQYRQIPLFDDMREKSKIEVFQDHLRDYILKSNELTNYDIYNFTINHAHIPKHAVEVLKELKKQNKISYEGHSCISYNKCYKDKKEVRIVKVE